MIYSKVSPDGAERIDFYHPTRWQSWFHTDEDMPASVTLTRLAGEETLGASGVFNLAGGAEVFWDKATVQIGSSAVFDRDTGKWTIVD